MIFVDLLFSPIISSIGDCRNLMVYPSTTHFIESKLFMKRHHFVFPNYDNPKLT